MPIVRYFVASLLLTAAALAAENPTDTPAPSTDPKDLELIHTILKHNRAAIERIKTLRLEQTWTSTSQNTTQDTPDDPPVGEQVTSCRVTYLVKGKWFKADVKYLTEVRGTSYHRETRRQTLVNGTSSTWVIPIENMPQMKQKTIVSRVDYSHIDNMPASAVQTAESRRPMNALDFVSANHFNLEKHLRNGRLTWEVERSTGDGGTRYAVTWRDQVRSESATYFFDPDKDFLLVAAKTTRAKGRSGYQLDVTLAIMNGVWFPNRVHEYRPGGPAVLSLYVVKADVNSDILDSEFDFDTLEFDRTTAGMTVYRESDPRPVGFLFRDGKWVPEELLRASP